MLPAFAPFTGLLLPLIIVTTPCPTLCTCVPLTTEQKYRLADEVFLAEVVALEEIPNTRGEGSSTWAIVQVTRRIKGEPPTQLGLPSGLGPDCLVDFQLGERYLVFANRHGDQRATSWCAGSALLLTEHAQRRMAEVEALAAARNE